MAVRKVSARSKRVAQEVLKANQELQDRVNGTSKRVAKKKTAQPAKKAPAKVVQVRVQFDIMVSVGEADERSYEEFRDDIVNNLKDPNGPVGAKNVTTMSGYYLVNGKVCLPQDYDPETRDFKPGCRPPLWAMSADEQKIAQRVEREKSRPEIARQPAHLRTSTETDEYHELLKKDPEAAREHRKNEVKKSLDGIERRSQIVEDIEDEDDIEDVEEFEDEEEEPRRGRTPQKKGRPQPEEVDDEPEDDEDDVEEIEDEWEEGDEFDEGAADEVVATSSLSVLARLRAKNRRT